MHERHREVRIHASRDEWRLRKLENKAKYGSLAGIHGERLLGQLRSSDVKVS
jgi:hypothetical protein